MSFWDGTRWVPPSTPAPRDRARPRRLRDWLATGLMIVGLVLIGVPSTNTVATNPALAIAPQRGLPGDKVTISGTDLASNTWYQVTWSGIPDAMPKAKTSRSGILSAPLVVPSAPAGLYVVSLAPLERGNAARSALVGPLPSTTFEVASAQAAEATATSTASASPAPPTVSPTSTSAPSASPAASPSATPTAAPTLAPTMAPTMAPTPAPTPTPVPAAPASSKLLFGVGPAVDSARNARLTQEAPVRIMSTWYNGAGDLGWQTDAYHQSMYDQQYAAGRSVHLIVWTGDGETTVATSYGTACGRPYPLSDRFLGDMRQLATAFAGSGTLYVTLFTEFQTFACTDNAWNPNPQTNAYWRALKDRYLAAMGVFHQHAPNSRVSLGWGGWQTRWNDTTIGGGRSMFGFFADVMGASDFQSFQAMQSDTNVADVRAMLNTLNDFGAVMLAHYKPNNGSQATFDADTRAMLTDAFVGEMVAGGLFAWSFMDQANLNASEGSYLFVRDAVRRYGR